MNSILWYIEIVILPRDLSEGCFLTDTDALVGTQEGTLLVNKLNPYKLLCHCSKYKKDYHFAPRGGEAMQSNNEDRHLSGHLELNLNESVCYNTAQSNSPD